MPLIKQHRIYRKDLQANPSIFYVFGDNEARVGKGGQALEMRGETNAIGVRTKRTPGVDPSAYWTDDTLVENCKMIDEDFNKIFMALAEDHIVVFPLDGIGTGLAELNKRAPKTLRYLNNVVDMLSDFNARAF